MYINKRNIFSKHQKTSFNSVSLNIKTSITRADKIARDTPLLGNLVIRKTRVR